MQAFGYFLQKKMQQGKPSGLAKNARGGICPAGRDCSQLLSPRANNKSFSLKL